MSCSHCGQNRAKTVAVATPTPVAKTASLTRAEASEDPSKRVRVRYYGGGVSAKKKATCAVCGAAKGSYSRVTNEMIMFASDDAPNGLYQQMVEAGRDYWVTEKQAEYMLSLTYLNQSGETVHKFKLVD